MKRDVALIEKELSKIAIENKIVLLPKTENKIVLLPKTKLLKKINRF
jgi:hypothetical protein